MTELPYDVIGYITSLSYEPDIINFLSINTYHAKYPYYIKTNFYKEISKKAIFRKFYPTKYVAKNNSIIPVFMYLKKIDMSYQELLKLSSDTKINHLVLTRIGKAKNIIITDKYTIETLELRNISDKPLEINCCKINNLKIEYCYNINIKIIDEKNNLKTLICSDDSIFKIINELNNSNLILEKPNLDNYTSIKNCTIIDKSYDEKKLETYMKKSVIDNSVKIRLEHDWGDIPPKYSLSELGLKVEMISEDSDITKNYYSELTEVEKSIQHISNNHKINLRLKKSIIIFENCNLNNLIINCKLETRVIIRNCNITKLEFLLSSSSISLENCCVNKLCVNTTYNRKISTLNINNSYIQNFKKSIADRLLILNLSITNTIINKYHNQLSHACIIDSKIYEMYNSYTGGYENIHHFDTKHIPNTYKFTTGKTPKKTILKADGLNILKLLLHSPIHIQGYPDYIYIDKKSTSFDIILESDKTTKINNSKIYTILQDKSYVYDIYMKNNYICS